MNSNIKWNQTTAYFPHFYTCKQHIRLHIQGIVADESTHPDQFSHPFQLQMQAAVPAQQRDWFGSSSAALQQTVPGLSGSWSPWFRGALSLTLAKKLLGSSRSQRTLTPPDRHHFPPAGAQLQLLYIGYRRAPQTAWLAASARDTGLSLFLLTQY